MNPSKNEILFKKFEILSCFKKDEHSAVYLANHVFLEKNVFLKVLNTKTIPDSTIINRFKREAKILAQLQHQNIINVYTTILVHITQGVLGDFKTACSDY